MPEETTGFKACRCWSSDDNAANRTILEEILLHWGMGPTVVDSGKSALLEITRVFESGAIPFNDHRLHDA